MSDGYLVKRVYLDNLEAINYFQQNKMNSLAYKKFPFLQRNEVNYFIKSIR